jgi:hypothetical protein
VKGKPLAFVKHTFSDHFFEERLTSRRVMIARTPAAIQLGTLSVRFNSWDFGSLALIVDQLYYELFTFAQTQVLAGTPPENLDRAKCPQEPKRVWTKIWFPPPSQNHISIIWDLQIPFVLAESCLNHVAHVPTLKRERVVHSLHPRAPQGGP